MAKRHSKFWILVNDVPEPTGIKEWSRWMEQGVDRVVAQTKIDQDTTVSTVFLGLDHYFGSDPRAPPILYETMIFGGPHGGKDRRYATREEALIGHAELVAEALGDDTPTPPPYDRRGD